jgi:hypothetical protein
MARPDERRFVTFQRGKVRDDIILARFRNVLRTKINPDSGQIFTEDEIAVITQEDSRFFVEADGIDIYGQAIQQRAVWFADQVRPERAASMYLNSFHGNLWLPEGKLSATGGSGAVTVTGSPGTIYVGSSTLGDPTANVARDPAGKRYQVLVTKNIPLGGSSTTISMVAIDAGAVTNLSAGTELTWVNPPIGSQPTALVLVAFTGGFESESDAEYAKRIQQRIRNKPGAGNSAQMRLWAQSASNAVEDAFIYPTAFHYGSALVVITQKRGTTRGPLARVASVGTLAAVTAFLVSPTSPVLPHGVHNVVAPVIPEPTNIAMKLAMPQGSSGGWTDVDPWPRYSTTYVEGVRVTNVTSQVLFQITTDEVLETAPVSGTLVPAMAIWNEVLSEFEALDVASIVSGGGDLWTITLNNAPAKTIAINDLICPKNERAGVIAESFQAYFDELGPGEAVDEADIRFVRVARFPRPDQEYPIRAGQGVIARLDDQLGGALSGAELSYISQVEPTIPNQVDELVNGTNILTLNHLGIYAFNS